MRSAVMLLLVGVLLAPGITQAKLITVEGVTQVPCSACHISQAAAKAPKAQVACSNCHLNFTADAFGPAGDVHKQEGPLKRP